MRINQKSLTLNKPVKKSRFSFKRLSFGKWNQILSGIVCIVGFALIFAMMLLYTLDDGEDSILNMMPPSMNNQSITVKVSNYNSKCASNGKCSLTCTQFGLTDDIPAIIEKEFELFGVDACGQQLDQLTLLDMTVTDSILRKKWLNSEVFYVDKLIINGGNIKNIEPGAFDSKALNNIRQLTIEQITFEKFTSETFLGLRQLDTLVIRKCSIFKIEQDAAKYISDTLKTLQIQEIINYFDPTNLTGTTNFRSISMVDLRFNNMVNTITSETFAGLSNCQQLFIANSQIDKIENKAFANLKKLLRLDMSENNIVTMQSTVFRKDGIPQSLYIQKNKWHCVCELKWLQNLKMIDVVKDKPLCETPSEAEDRFFIDVDFCPDGPTSVSTSTTTTTTYATTTTTKLPPPTSHNASSTSSQPTESTIEISCIEAVNSIGSIVNSNRKLLSLEYINLPKQKTLFNLSNGDTGIIKIDLDYSMSPTDIIIWFLGKLDLTEPIVNRNSIGCMSNLYSSVKINNLIVGETYIFCLIKETERKISPLNCRAHEAQKPWLLQTWLVNDDRIISLTILIVGYVLCCLIGAIFIYILVRRNPSLLRGSKRIMLVKHRAAEAIVVPSNFKDLSEMKTVDELKTSKTQKNRSSLKKIRFRRSVSDTSMFSLRSMDASYVSAVEPTAFQLLHWRLERLRSGENGATSKSDTPLVPPLSPSSNPPRLPDRPNISKLTIDEIQNISDYSEV